MLNKEEIEVLKCINCLRYSLSEKERKILEKAIRYFEKFNVDKVFDMLGVKPNENFNYKNEVVYGIYYITPSLDVYSVSGGLAGKVSYPNIQVFIENPSLINKYDKPRYTKEEIEIAKALHVLGATGIYRKNSDLVALFNNVEESMVNLPIDYFGMIDIGEYLYIADILKAGE